MVKAALTEESMGYRFGGVKSVEYRVGILHSSATERGLVTGKG